MIFLLYAHKISDGLDLSKLNVLDRSCFTTIKSMVVSSPESLSFFVRRALHVTGGICTMVVCWGGCWDGEWCLGLVCGLCGAVGFVVCVCHGGGGWGDGGVSGLHVLAPPVVLVL